MTIGRVILKPRRAKPFFGMHPWVFAGAIDRVEGALADGAEVELVTSDQQFIARGLYNRQSQIRVRLYSWTPHEALDVDFLRRQLAAAVRLRRDMLRLGGPGRACRLVFSEADGLSGLIVDQYDRWLAVQFTSLALAQRRAQIGQLLTELVEPTGIYLRTERGIGQLEGLELHDELLSGSAPEGPVTIAENGLQLQLNLTEGQKTGFYLDQRDNRQIVAALAVGRSMLDGFCYTGGFGLLAARAGAASVLGLDVSEPALTLARENAARNGLTNLSFERADVFERMDALVQEGRRLAWLSSIHPNSRAVGRAVDEALRAYRRMALRLLEDDAIFVMCCCTGLIARDVLHDLLAQVAAEMRQPLQILASRGPALDHPFAATCPETNYLKCVICRVR